MANQNITLSLPEEDLRRARILAVTRHTSVSKLLAGLLRDLVERDSGYAAARERAIESMAGSSDLGTGGHLRGSRDELHER